jgi:hypothetical protein
VANFVAGLTLSFRAADDDRSLIFTRSLKTISTTRKQLNLLLQGRAWRSDERMMNKTINCKLLVHIAPEFKLSELGGPTTQDGIFFQNSVAALALLELLELNPQPPRDRVVEVRLEAPEDVDDIVIRYADDHRQYQSVKTNVRPGTGAWCGLWNSVHAQFSNPELKADDELVLVVAEFDPTMRAIREACQRASTSAGDAEWRKRITIEQAKLLTTLPDHVRVNAF